MSCPHHRLIGDNYGTTCMDCGEQIEGYGNWAEGNGTCIHSWIDHPSNDKLQVCYYCEQERLKDGE